MKTKIAIVFVALAAVWLGHLGYFLFAVKTLPPEGAEEGQNA